MLFQLHKQTMHCFQNHHSTKYWNHKINDIGPVRALFRTVAMLQDKKKQITEEKYLEIMTSG
jgi:hypothetical protein